MSGTKPRRGKALMTVLTALLGLLLVYLAVFLFYGPLRHGDFYREKTDGPAYRDLGDGFVPQGVTVNEATGDVIVCGYLPEDRPSRIYVFSPEGRYKSISLQNADGSPYTGHAGGLTLAGDCIYISNAHRLFVLNAADVFSAKDGETLRFTGEIPVPCNASFCSSSGGYLYVGEFHAEGYDTDASHALDLGDAHFAALVFAYPLGANGSLRETASPVFAYAVPDEVQGFAVHGKTVFVSRSRGFSPSRIETYDGAGTHDAFFQWEEKRLPLYVLGENRAAALLSAPHMTEDLEVANGRLYIGFEAGAKKFGAGLLPGSVKKVVSLALEDIVKE